MTSDTFSINNFSELDSQILNIQAKSFLPSYKKPQSCYGKMQKTPAATSSKMQELDID